MATFTDPADFTFKHINQIDIPNISAADMKTDLDSQAKELRDYAIATLIPELETAITATEGNITTIQGDITTIQGDVTTLETDLDTHEADYTRNPGYAVATGSADAYAVSTTPTFAALADGMCVSWKINADNTGASTLDWNSKGAHPVLDPKGGALTAGKLKSGSIVTVRYNATTTNFILQGEGSDPLTGDAAVGDVLTGKTFYNTDSTNKLTGTMTDKTSSGTTITPGTSDQAIPQGYYPGNTAAGKVSGDADLIASNIKSGVDIFGVTGTLSSSSIQSIQFGSVSMANNVSSNTAAISSVTVNNSLILNLGCVMGTFAADDASNVANVDITSSTQVTAARSANHNAITVYFLVIEFVSDSVKTSRQSGSVTMTNATSGTSILATTITTSKWILLPRGIQTALSTNNDLSVIGPTLEFNGSDIIGSHRASAGDASSISVGYNIIELN